MIAILNLTPHDIVICGKTYTAAKQPLPRVEMMEIEIGEYAGFPAVTQTKGVVVGLPEPKENVFLLVSRMVFDAVSDERIDVIAPDTGVTALRNQKGQIMGVTRIVCKEKGVKK
jgi:hypothetical protein